MARGLFDTAGDYFRIADHQGETMLFVPTAYVTGITTSFGEKDAVLTDVVEFTGGGVTEHYDVMIFQGSMIGALKRKIHPLRHLLNDITDGRRPEGAEAFTYLLDMDDDARDALIEAALKSRPLLATVGKGEAKKGQNAPYIPVSPSESDIELANGLVTPDLLSRLCPVNKAQAATIVGYLKSVAGGGASTETTVSTETTATSTPVEPDASARAAEWYTSGSDDNPFKV